MQLKNPIGRNKKFANMGNFASRDCLGAKCFELILAIDHADI